MGVFFNGILTPRDDENVVRKFFVELMPRIKSLSNAIGRQLLNLAEGAPVQLQIPLTASTRAFLDLVDEADELAQIIEVAERFNVTVVSDSTYTNFVYEGK
ncbi:hypothetical protein DID80_00620 [Candidatus Marinamargulisbacteria bacterium SCGC AAA071-K20]|nr:hypothetical protein DID80_00620 [Candidatus Marinamargulisbacteria bacterium SCGC AAA071-K20]